MTLTSLAHLVDLNWMKEAYRRTREDGAVGVDGMTAATYEQDLEVNLLDLLERAKSGRYLASPVRRVHMPIGAVEDVRLPGVHALLDTFQEGQSSGGLEDGEGPPRSRAKVDQPVVPRPSARRPGAAACDPQPEATGAQRVLRDHGEWSEPTTVPFRGRSNLEEVAWPPIPEESSHLGVVQPGVGPRPAPAGASAQSDPASRSECMT